MQTNYSLTVKRITDEEEFIFHGATKEECLTKLSQRFFPNQIEGKENWEWREPNQHPEKQPEEQTAVSNVSNVSNEATDKVKDNIEATAIACHNANKAWCEANGDFSQKEWHDADEWQRESSRNGVKYRVQNRNLPFGSQHEAWLADKLKEGWVYGEQKDAEKKTHPCILPFEQLPTVQRAKDIIFCIIVDTLL